MASSLLDRSLDDIAASNGSSKQASSGSRRGRGGGRQQSSGTGRGGRSSASAPYSKPLPRSGAGAGAGGDPDGAWTHDLFKTDKLDYGGDGDDDGSSSSRAAAAVAARRRLGNTNEARSTRLRITNLHYEVSEAELEALFKQVGALAPGTPRETNPAIKFDHSGRSTGEAFVTYESEADAARALEVFHNALAKGERISLEYDFRGPPRPRRGADADAAGGSWKSSSGANSSGGRGGVGGSLLARMDKSSKDTGAGAGARGGFVSSIGRAPISDRAGAQSQARGGGRGAPRASVPRGGGGGRSAARGGGGKGDRGAAKTAEDLDRELEEFMAKGSSSGVQATTTTTTVPAAGAEDVEMS